jgi:hypothetical protein
MSLHSTEFCRCRFDGGYGSLHVERVELEDGVHATSGALQPFLDGRGPLAGIMVELQFQDQPLNIIRFRNGNQENENETKVEMQKSSAY